MSEITTNKKLTETENRRLRNYLEKIEKRPEMNNRILINHGEARMITFGDVEPCKVQGYIKLPGREIVERIEQLDLCIAFLPKGRLIVTDKNKNFYFREYKKGGNTEDFMILCYAESDTRDWMFIDLGKEEIPLFSVIESDEMEKGEQNFQLFQICEYLFLNNTWVQSEEMEHTEVDVHEEEENDEWE